MKFELHTAAQGKVLQAYRDSRSRVSLIMGPLGSGKTFESCQKIFTFMCTQKPNSQGIRKSRWYAIRNTYPDLLSTTVKDWIELFGELGRYKGGGMEPPCHYLKFRLADKSIVQAELLFLALDRPQSIKKLRGAQVTGFWLNETKELDKAIIDMADFRHGRYPSAMEGGPSWHGMIGDTNAPDDDSWYYELAEEEKPEGWTFFKQPGGLLRELDEKGKWTGKWLVNENAENLCNLPEDYYKAGQEGKKHDWIAVNLANEYGSVMDGQPIYKNQWNETIHLSANPIGLIPNHPIEIGLDFGLTPAAVIGQQDSFGQVRIIEELCATGMGIKQFVKGVLKPTLNKRYKKCDVTYVGDPAGNRRADTDEETVFKVLRDLGIECEAANSNDPTIRWEAVRDFLESLRDGKPAFLLSPTCKLLRKGFNGGYRLRRLQVAGEARFTEKADKNKFSHPHDALQYLMMYYRGDYGDVEEFERPPDEDTWGT
jgi:hypothetical protein